MKGSTMPFRNRMHAFQPYIPSALYNATAARPDGAVISPWGENAPAEARSMRAGDDAPCFRGLSGGGVEHGGQVEHGLRAARKIVPVLLDIGAVGLQERADRVVEKMPR